MDMLEIWNQVLENLEGNVSPVGFNIHIKTAVPVCFENSTFTISVATSINKNLVEYRYKKYIESSLEKVTGAKISLACGKQERDWLCISELRIVSIYDGV